jgi:hypothetical protein
MKKVKWVQICCLLLVCIGFAGWATYAAAQPKQDAGTVEKEMGKYMPLLTGNLWQKMEPNAKVAFIWGAAHVILIEGVLMEEIPELKRDSFVSKVIEARRARVSAGKAMTINQIIDAIDQYYKSHPDQLGLSVMQVIWISIKPDLKTGIAGRPLK